MVVFDCHTEYIARRENPLVEVEHSCPITLYPVLVHPHLTEEYRREINPTPSCKEIVANSKSSFLWNVSLYPTPTNSSDPPWHVILQVYVDHSKVTEWRCKASIWRRNPLSAMKRISLRPPLSEAVLDWSSVSHVWGSRSFVHNHTSPSPPCLRVTYPNRQTWSKSKCSQKENLS